MNYILIKNSRRAEKKNEYRSNPNEKQVSDLQKTISQNKDATSVSDNSDSEKKFKRLNAVQRLRLRITEYLTDELKFDTLNNELKAIRRRQRYRSRFIDESDK